MKQIFVYGDSLSWGLIPDTRKRRDFHERWPGVLEKELLSRGRSVRVIEDCLNGRRTVWEDPFKPGRNGLQNIAQRIESNSPLDLVILMLGANDFQIMHAANNAWLSGQGILALIHSIRQAPVEPGMPVPPILIFAPPPIREPKGIIAPKFLGGDKKCVGLAEAYREVAAIAGCQFFDTGSVIQASPVDGIHLDLAEQLKLGEEAAKIVEPILFK